MDASTMITVGIVVVVLVVFGAILAWYFSSRQRSQRLREQFGPEYDRILTEAEDQHKAEAELEAREERVKSYDIHPLTPEQHDRYAKAWRSTQAHFVDEPTEAVVDADQLVSKVMKDRGYPMADFEQRAADVSVDHANVVTHYRAAHDLATKNNRGDADTEDLRQAMVHYRALFEDLLEAPQDITMDKEKVS